ncbi:MAG: phytanoyl-CoA dioxygenase family protein [Gemmataceae bacterium]|nr:phytanoyl-CoA dioxygenase family protein [Gemmataceae bacterium]
MKRLLSKAQKLRYEQDGILFPVRVLSLDEAHGYRAACDALEVQLGGKPRTIEVRQMHLHFPWACALATHAHVLDAVEDLLGPNLLVWATELFAKHAHDPARAIGWHCDRPYMGFDPRTAVTAWIALSDSTVANGCMRAVPGPLRLQGAGRRIEVDEAAAIDVVLKAGEMSLHDVLIPHGSGPNHSGEKRVGFAIRYVTPAARPPNGRPPAILARGDYSHDYFQLVDPPTEKDAEHALAEMKSSAARHFEVMLQNLKRADA